MLTGDTESLGNGSGSGFWNTVTVFSSTLGPDTVMVADRKLEVEGLALLTSTLIVPSPVPLVIDTVSQSASSLTLQLVFEFTMKLLKLPER